MQVKTLADSLNIILPELKTQIASPETQTRLQNIAKLLPPIIQGGFECRLSQELIQVDLQQCIKIKEYELKIFAEHLATFTSSNKSLKLPAWERIYNLCQACIDTNSCLYKGITDIWLEFDINESNSLITSIFISFNYDITDLYQTLNVAETVLEILLDKPIAESLKINLSRCFIAAAPGRISHLGVMLSRDLQVLRVNVSQLPLEEITPYLKNIGFPGAVYEIETLMSQLFNFVDRIRICLDVGETIYHKIGLECLLNQKSELESRCSTFLDYLVKQGLCTLEKRDALLAWLGYTTPQFSSHPWSSHLIAESLLKPPNQFSAIARRLSHIKLTYSSQHPLQAKGYLEFNHQWLQPNYTKEETKISSVD